MSVDAFKAFGEQAANYGAQYKGENFTDRYPDGRIRLDIFIDLLRSIGPKRVLDIGCGSAGPLCSFLDAGFDAEGFDYSPEMVEAGRAALQEAGHDLSRISRNNMEAIEGIDPGHFDCAVALGSVYYARDFEATLKGVVDLLPPGGHFVFSLRNDLFSLFSLNAYSIRFLMNEIMNASELPEDVRKKVFAYISSRLDDVGEKKFKTVDDLNIHSLWHNPLTIEDEVLRPIGLRGVGTYFYHYHALPPAFEHEIPEQFRALSLAMENPTDWRGNFMASTFIVHAIKD